MGTPEFAVAGLEKLVNSKHEIVGVVTTADKPAGRGRKMNESAVKRFAMENGLAILQPLKLRNQHFLEALKSLDADLFVIVAFRMLPEVVWAMPKHGTFNLHASLLPQYRGAAPINWAVINGEKETGVTTFFIDDKIDTGAILFQKSIPIEPKETAGSLHDKLMHLGSDLILETVDAIASGNAEPTKQEDSNELKKAPKIFREDCRIDWSMDGESILQKIRGLSPYPAAWTIIDNDGEEIELKIFDADFAVQDHNSETGTIITSKNELKIMVENGVINLLQVQLSGKRKMDVQALLNGFRFKEMSKML